VQCPAELACRTWAEVLSQRPYEVQPTLITIQICNCMCNILLNCYVEALWCWRSWHLINLMEADNYCGLWPNKSWPELSTSQSKVNFFQNRQFPILFICFRRLTAFNQPDTTVYRHGVMDLLWSIHSVWGWGGGGCLSGYLGRVHPIEDVQIRCLQKELSSFMKVILDTPCHLDQLCARVVFFNIHL
jgi:hypothetical protein